jgi:hypothetical protein
MIPIKREKTQWWLRRDPALHCVRGCPTAIIGRKARANSARWLAGALVYLFSGASQARKLPLVQQLANDLMLKGCKQAMSRRFRRPTLAQRGSPLSAIGN